MRWYTKEFMVDSMTTRCPGPATTKQTQIISTPPPWLTVGMRRLVFLQMELSPLRRNMSKHVSSVQRKHAPYFFSLDNPSTKPKLFKLFSNFSFFRNFNSKHPQSDFGGNLLQRPLLRGLATVCHLWIIFLTEECWIPSSLRKGLTPFPQLLGEQQLLL